MTKKDSTKKRLSPRPRKNELKRRRRELIIAAIAFVVMLVLISIQLGKLYAGDRLFMALFTVNFTILLVVLLVVVRNGFKLFLERRQRILGSGLRARLTLAFVGLASMPCVLMLVVTTKYVQISMDFWFKEQIETSIDMAMDLSTDVYSLTEKKLRDRGFTLINIIKNEYNEDNDFNLQKLLEEKRSEYGYVFAAVTNNRGDLLRWSSAKRATIPYNDAKENLSWSKIQELGYTSTLTPGFDGDFLFSIIPFGNLEENYLVLTDNLGAGFKARFDRVSAGANEYKYLRKFKRSLKGLLYSSLAVLTALIMLGAVWLAFRLGRQIAAPVLAVAKGTKRIAQGDLSVRLEDAPTDEMGTLVRSFNKMAQDLEASRQDIISFNYQLEKQNERIARHSDYIETVLDNIAAGVVSFDANGQVATMNKAASEILHMNIDNVLGKKIEEVLDEPYASKAANILDLFSSKKRTNMRYTVSIPLGGEERRLLITSVGFSTGGVYSGSVAVFEDISEMEKMQRLAAWREVARRIAHEIKNPLTPIKLSAERMAKKFGHEVKDPVFLQSISLIVEQVEHLQAMVQEFSAFAKLPEANPKMGRIEPLLIKLVELFRSSHANIKWELEIPENLPELSLDQEAVSRAFMNLFTNAAEALVATKTPNPLVRTRVSYINNLNQIHISVENNGPGLSESQRAQIFEPYFTSKKGGTGLGLTIVRSIISDHLGYVRALPREEGGLIISVELPLGV